MIRHANNNDLEAILSIYADARKFIAITGSPQWQNNYPNKEILIKDIEKKHLYVYEDGSILGVMAVMDYESTYDFIEGNWLSNKPYKVIHRIATKLDTHQRGIASAMIDYVFKELHAKSIRIDTHELNQPMQQLMKKLGFTYCGIIYLNQIEDRKRLAYQKDILDT